MNKWTMSVLRTRIMTIHTVKPLHIHCMKLASYQEGRRKPYLIYYVFTQSGENALTESCNRTEPQDPLEMYSIRI